MMKSPFEWKYPRLVRFQKFKDGRLVLVTKPSGTASVLRDRTDGMHPALGAPYGKNSQLTGLYDQATRDFTNLRNLRDLGSDPYQAIFDEFVNKDPDDAWRSDFRFPDSACFPKRSAVFC